MHAYFFVVRAFLDDLKKSLYGRVINMTSTRYLESGLQAFVSYVTSKGAGRRFHQFLATDLSRYDITVNAVAPKIVRTPTTERHLNDEIFDAHIQLQNLKR